MRFFLSIALHSSAFSYVSDSLISRLAVLENSVEKVNTLNKLALFFMIIPTLKKHFFL